MPQNVHTAFDKIEFPPYAYREYPKAIPVDEEGKPVDDHYVAAGAKKLTQRPVVIVRSRREEDALRGPGVTTVEVSPGTYRVENEDDVREVLFEQAETRGVAIDRSWSVERIEQALADAEADPDEVV